MKSVHTPLVTISIPTFNSEAFIALCLQAIQKQSYKNVEVNIVDGGSTDETVEIAKQFGIKVINYKKALLGARFEGIKHAKGTYTLLLDSDQILEKKAIENAVRKMEDGNDMLVLEEAVYSNKTWIEKLFEADRKLIHLVKDFSPETGVMLPRMYKTTFLRKVFSEIPKNILEKVGGQDHAIIYYEAWKKSHRVGFLPKAVKHIEPNSLRTIWKKFYRWGYTSVNAHYDRYEEMLVKKERFRTGLFKNGMIKESIASVILLLFKGIPYKLGYYSGKYHI